MKKRYEENIENIRFGVGLGRVLGGGWEGLGRSSGCVRALLEALGAVLERLWAALGAMLDLSCQKSEKTRKISGSEKCRVRPPGAAFWRV